MTTYDLGALVAEVLANTGVQPDRLELEITEEAVVTDDGTVETLGEVRAMGVRLAMDDFGTGNSSIAYLRRLRMDRIKIDRSFVVDIATKQGDPTSYRRSSAWEELWGWRFSPRASRPPRRLWSSGASVAIWRKATSTVAPSARNSWNAGSHKRP